MLYNTKLNEFDLFHLNALLQIVEEKIDDVNYHIQKCESLPQGDTRRDLEMSYDVELNMFILWKVQILNAKEDVKNMEKVNAG